MVRFFAYIWPAILLVSTVFAQVNKPERLTNHPAFDYDPAVSPNGRYLAFTSLRSGNEDIWLLDLKSRRLNRLTDHSAADYKPVFKSDNELAFISLRENAFGDIFILNWKNGNIKKAITGTGYLDYPSINADGRYLAYCESSGDEGVQIYIYDLKKKIIRPGPKGLSPSFSHKGLKLIYSVTLSVNNSEFDLGLYDLSNDSSTYFNIGSELALNPCFSVDDRELIFTAYREDSNHDGMIDQHDRGELLRYDIQSRMLSNVLFTRESAEMPTSRGSQTHLYYAARDADGYDIMRVGENGPVDTSVTETSADSFLKRCFNAEDSILAAHAFLILHDKNEDDQYLYRAAVIFDRCGYLVEAERIFLKLADPAPGYYSGLALIELARFEFQKVPRDDIAEADHIYKTALLDIVKNALYPEVVRATAQFELIKISYNEGELYKSLKMLTSLPRRYGSALAVAARSELMYLTLIKDNFPGDPLELIPLYLEISDKYSGVDGFRGKVDSSIVDMLVESNDPEGYLRLLIRSYAGYNNLTGLASLRLAELLVQSGREKDAYKMLANLSADLSIHPDLKFKVLTELSVIARNQSDYDPALAYSDSALDMATMGIAPVLIHDEKRRQVDLILDIARNLQGSGSIELYRKALEIDPENLQGMFGFIETYRKYDSLKNAEKLIGDHPNMPQSTRLYALGLIEMVFGNTIYNEKGKLPGTIKKSSLKKAAELIEQSLSLNYDNIGAFISLGYIYTLLESVDSKGEYAEKAVDLGLMGLALADEIESTFFRPALYGNTAEAYFLVGNYVKAFEYYKKRLNLSAEFDSEQSQKSFLIKYAESAYQSDSLAEAFDLYSSLLELSAGDTRLTAEISGKLGLISQLLGYHGLALDYFEQSLPYFKATGNLSALADIHKASALSYLNLGEFDAARREAEIAAGCLAESGGGERFKAQDRVIFSILNFNIPTFKMEAMKFGETEYPEGFTIGAENAFIRTVVGDVAKKENDVFQMLSDEKSKARILDDRGEHGKLGTIYNSIGLEYLNLGYRDSAAVYFYQAIKNALESVNIIGAYNVLTNLGYSLYDLSGSTNIISASDRIKNIRIKFGKLSREVNKLLPSEYYLARANVFILQGTAEFRDALTECYNSIASSNAVGLVEYHNNTDFYLDGLFNRLNKAEVFFDSAMAIAQTFGLVDIQAAVMIHKAFLMFYRGDRQAAESYFLKAQNRADITGSDELRIKIATARLAEFAGSLTEYEQVLETIDRHPGGIVLDALVREKFFENYFNSCLASDDPEKLWIAYQQQVALRFVTAVSCYPMGWRNNAGLEKYLDELNGQAEAIAILNGQIQFYGRKKAVMSVRLKKAEKELAETRANYYKLRQQVIDEFPDLERLLFIAPPFISEVKEVLEEGDVFVEVLPFEGQFYYWLFDKRDLASGRADNLRDIEDALDLFAKDFKHLYIAGDDKTAFWMEQTGSGEKSISFLGGAAELIELKKIYHPHLDNKLLLSSDPDADYSARIRREMKFDGSVDLDSLDSNFENSVRGYGFLHIDANFDFNPLCPPASHFKGDEPRLSLYRLYDLELEVGLVYLDGLDINDSFGNLESIILLNLWSKAGIQAVCLADRKAGEKARFEFAKSFYNHLDSLSPGTAFIKALTELQVSGCPDSLLSCFKYFGLPGDNLQGRHMLSEKIFFSRMLKGRRYSMMQDWAQAAYYYISALELARETAFSDSLAIKEQIIANALEGGLYDIALSYQYEILKSAELTGDDPVIRAANSRLEKIYAAAGDFDKAAEAREALMAGQSHTERVISFETLADYYMQNGDIQFALNALDSARAINYTLNDLSAVARISVLSGRLNLKRNNIGEALDQLKSAADILEKFDQSQVYAEALKYLGIAYNLAGYYHPAKAALNKASTIFIDLNNQGEVRACYRNLATGYLHCQRLDSARVYHEKASTGHGIDADDLVVGARIKRLGGDISGAVEDIKSGINSVENNRSLLYKLHSEIAALYLEQKQYYEAGDNFKLALEFADNDPRSIYNLADYYLKTGHLFLADSLLQSALETGELGDDFRLTGLCQYKLGLLYIENPEVAAAFFLAADSMAGLSNFYPLRNLARFQLYRLGIDGYDFEFMIESLRQSPPESPWLDRLYGFDLSETMIAAELAGKLFESGEVDRVLTLAELERRRKFAGRLLLDSINHRDYQGALTRMDSLFYSENSEGSNLKVRGDIYSDLIYSYTFRSADYRARLQKTEAYVSIYRMNPLAMIAIITSDSLVVFTDRLGQTHEPENPDLVDNVLNVLINANIETVYSSNDDSLEIGDYVSMLSSRFEIIYQSFLTIPDRSALMMSEFSYREPPINQRESDVRGYLITEALRMSLLDHNIREHELSIANKEFNKSSDQNGTQLVLFPYINVMDTYPARRDMFRALLNGSRLGLLLSEDQQADDVGIYIKLFCRKLARGLTIEEAYRETIADISPPPFMISIF